MSPERVSHSRRGGRNGELLAEAHRARNRGRERRAIALYKRILLEDPHNADVALRVAPMLARRGNSFEAWQIYRAAARDFALVGEFGFSTATTTRKGVLFPEHADHLHALPRVSLNGDFQNLPHLRALLSGAPFILKNGMRRLDVT